jgi:hypothetical protein
MRVRLGWLLGLIFCGMAATGPARAQGDASLPVLELFTSQGCSSCPAADALLKTYADRSDVVALSLPVDYWDYLGWKDTLASPKFTSRQRGYAKVRGDGQVFTPQVVVNGLLHVVGSHRHDIDDAIGRTGQKLVRMRVALAAWTERGTITIEAGEGEGWRQGTVWVAAVRPKVAVAIEAGENRGKQLAYYNVVRELTPAGMWSGKAVKLELPHGDVLRAGEKCAVFIQDGTGGPIVAATWMSVRP